MEWHRGRCRHHKTEWLSSVFRDALPDKDFYDRHLTRRLNSIHRKEQCRNAGSCRSSSLRHTSFLSGLPRFSFSVFMSIAATAGAAKIYVFMGFHPGEPFQSVRTDNKWVRYKLLAIAKRVAKGYSSGFGIKNLQTSCVGSYFFHQGPKHPSFAPHAFQVSSNSYNHTVFGRMVKKKLPPI